MFLISGTRHEVRREVTGFGSFEKSLQKALRMLENGEVFLTRHDLTDEELKEELKAQQTSEFIYAKLLIVVFRQSSFTS